MNVLDLFSGIGGFSLGLERAGMKTRAFCEMDKFCRKVLLKHWPTITCFSDVKKLSVVRGKLRQRVTTKSGHWDFVMKKKIDVICGGFPCQDISIAGKQEGIHGKKSGLWKEFKRLIGEIKPKYAIIENVANLRSKGLGVVLKDLWEVGYDCEWHIISAAAFGAPHIRERVWIIAYPNGKRMEGHRLSERLEKKIAIACGIDKSGEADTTNSVQGGLATSRAEQQAAGTAGCSKEEMEVVREYSYWEKNEPPVCGVDVGVPHRVDRIKALGNSLVPQIAEVIGRAIMETEE